MKAFNYNPETAALAGSFEDVIFENRNKLYGAYYLRKNYSNHLFYAFCITTSLLVAIFLYPVIRSYIFPPEAITLVFDTPVEFNPEDIKIYDDIIVPPPPVIEVPKELRVENIYAPPLVVPDEVINHTIEMPSIVEVSTPPFEETNAIFQNPSSTPVVDLFDDTQPGLLVVSENAMFLGGGVEKFREWIMEKIVYPQYLSEIGISEITVLEFSISSKGEICDIKILKSLHNKLDKDVTNILLSSPVWIPAKYNGSAVKQRMTLPITFKIQ